MTIPTRDRAPHEGWDPTAGAPCCNRRASSAIRRRRASSTAWHGLRDARVADYDHRRLRQALMDWLAHEDLGSPDNPSRQVLWDTNRPCRPTSAACASAAGRRHRDGGLRAEVRVGVHLWRSPVWRPVQALLALRRAGAAAARPRRRAPCGGTPTGTVQRGRYLAWRRRRRRRRRGHRPSRRARTADGGGWSFGSRRTTHAATPGRKQVGTAGRRSRDGGGLSRGGDRDVRRPARRGRDSRARSRKCKCASVSIS